MTTRKPVIQKKVRGAYHHGDLRAALKRAALRQVREQGPRGFSLNEASRLAGVTAAAPYRHFEDKEALLAEIACDGLALMVRELREAAAMVSGIKKQMFEVGMAYLHFSSVHSDYFAVIFNAGLEVGRGAEEAFRVILELSQQAERTPELAAHRAVSFWALAHGFATLTADGALSTAVAEKPKFEHLRPILQQFLSQPYGSAVPETRNETM